MGKKNRDRKASQRSTGGGDAAAAVGTDAHDCLSAFRECCATSLSAEYDALSADAQKSLLAAFEDHVRQRAMSQHLGMMQLGPQLPGMRPAACAAESSGQCSLAHLLRRMFPSVEPKAQHVAEIRSELGEWAVERPDWMVIMGMAVQRQGLQQMEQGAQQGQFLHMGTNTSVRKAGSRTGPVDWDSLQPITRAGLALFQTAKGKVLEGLIATPPVNHVGVNTIVNDASGRPVQVALYNQAPGGKAAFYSAAFLAQKFSEGTRIAIAEPYYKVSASGNRMIRVDSPAEVRVISGTAKTAPAQAQPLRSSQKALAMATGSARQLLRCGEPEAAQQAALDALRAPHNHSVALVCVLLSNRAQSQLRAGCTAAALRDAAAVLTMSPQNPKAWLRYTAALRALKSPVAERAVAVSGQAVAPTDADPPDDAGVPGWNEAVRLADVSSTVCRAVCVAPDEALQEAADRVSAEKWKERGNAKYQEGRHLEAAGCYSRGLLAVPGADEAAALLTLVAEASLRCSSRHTALAAAAACLRLVHVAGSSHKAVPLAMAVLAQALLALGENESCQEMLSGSASCAELLRACDRRTLLHNAGVLAQLGSGTPCIATLSQLSPETAPDIIKHAKLVAIPGKGRGLVAMRALPPETPVILNPALTSASHDVNKTKTHMFNFHGNSVLTAAQSALSSKAVQIACREPLAAAMLLGLDDNDPGSNHRRDLPLVPLRDMQQLLSPRVLPLLPSTAEFFPVAEGAEVPAARVDRVCSVNAHGSGEHSFEKTVGNLFPVVSLMNHSGDNNCSVMSLEFLRGMPCVSGLAGHIGGDFSEGGRGGDNVMAVMTNRAVAAGEELTVKYHEDPAVLKRSWGL